MERELIDANALMEFARNHINQTIDCNDIVRFPRISLKSALTAKWNWVFNRPYTAAWGDAYLTGWECSNCGHGASMGVHTNLDNPEDENAFKTMYDERGNYCSNCGAKMEKGNSYEREREYDDY